VHTVAAWRTQGHTPRRIRGRELQRLRAALFARQPWCVRCLKDGRRTRPTIRDHIVALAFGGRDDESNEQALCADCSTSKTEAESRRGAHRSRVE
jgi:5-methylcytosine-specific restriction protein A